MASQPLGTPSPRIQPLGIRPRRRRFFVFFAALIVLPLVLVPLLLLTAWTLLHPEQVDLRVRRALAKELAVPFEMDPVEFDLFAGATLHNLRIQAPEAYREATMLEADEVHLDLRLIDLLLGRVTLDFVRIVRPRLHLERDGEGTLNVLQLLPPDRKTSIPHFRPPEVVLSDVELSFCPDTVISILEPMRLPHLNLARVEGRESTYALEGTILHPEWRRLSLEGTWNARSGDLEGSVKALRVTFDERLRKRLPDSLRDLYDKSRPEGQANITLDVTSTRGRLKSWRARVEIVAGSLHPSIIPLPIESLSGTAEISPGRVEIVRPFTGLAGRGNARLEGKVAYEEQDLSSYDLTFTLDEISLGPETREFIKAWEEDLRIVEQLSPRGRLGIVLKVRGGESVPEDLKLEFRLNGVSVTPQVFPYTIDGLRGTITIENDTITLTDVVGGAEATPVKIWGTAHLGPEGAIDLNVRVENMVLGSEVERALSGNPLKYWRQLDPGGRADVRLWFLREEGKEAEPEMIIALHGRGASLRYHLFPYLIEDIHGEIRFLRDGVRFGNLRGKHGTSEIALEKGHIRVRDGTDLYLEIHSGNLLIERDLIAALPADTREIVGSFAPRGRLDTTVKIEGTNEQVSTTVTAGVAESTKIRYEALPYELVFSEGTATIDVKDRSVHFQDFRTDPAFGPRITINGDFATYPGDRRKKELDLKFKVRGGTNADGKPTSGLTVDSKLIRSLPSELSNFIERLKIEGEILGDFTILYRYVPGKTGPERLEEVEYDGDLTVNDGAIDFGMQLHEIAAKLDCAGDARPGVPHNFTGEATVRRFRFSRFQGETAKLHFCYGSRHEAVRPGSQYLALEKKGLRLSNPFTGRLRNDQFCQKTLQLLIEDGKVYDGDLEGFLYVDVGEQKDFYARLEASNVDLSKGGKDLFRDEDVQGRAEGWVTFGGDTSIRRHLRGEGRVSVKGSQKDGRLVKLPAIARILSPFSDPTEPLYIETVDINRFRIEEDRFVVDDYEDMIMKSKQLKLEAKGHLTFGLILDFYIDPEFFNVEIPGVKQLLSLLQLLPFQRLHLHGPLDDPQTNLPAY